MVFATYLVFACFFLNLSSPSAVDGQHAQAVPAGKSRIEERQLSAASRDIDIAKRSSSIVLDDNISMHYVDANNDVETTASPFTASVSFKSKLPSLLLEDIEHLVDRIQCKPESIELTFTSKEHMETARDAFASHPNLVIVTSHFGCNNDDSRIPWVVSRCSFSDEDSTATLFARPVPWRDTFHSMQVSFDRTQKGYRQRSPHIMQRYHKNLDRLLAIRVAADAEVSASVATLPSVSAPSATTGTPTLTSINFPFPTASVTPIATSAVKDVSAQLIDYPILPSNSSVLADIEGHVLPPGLNVKCTNCTTAGTIELLSGSFTVGSPSSNDTESIVQFIEHGYVEVVTNKLFAHIALDSTWQPQTGASYTVDLAEIPLQPYSIPDIAVIGPYFNPRLILGVNLSTQLDFKYGFEVSIPDNSTIKAVVGNITQSTVTGFKDTSLKTLPFQASIANVELNLTATLQPEILIGVSFLNGAGNVGFGAFLQLPQLVMSIAQVSNTDNQCQPLGDNALSENHIFDSLNLTHIVPQAEFGAGLIAQGTLGVGGVNAFKGQTSYLPFATTFTAPTACLAFDKKGKSYVPATATASGTATALVTQKGAANSIGNAFAREGSNTIILHIIPIILPIVVGWFLGL